MDMPLQIDSLNKYYGTFHAVKDASFSIGEGEIFGLLGPNGAGKTTIISTIVTLENPSSGTVSIFGKNVHEHPIEAKRLVGVVPQELINYGFFTLDDLLMFQSSYYGIRHNQSHINFLLKKLDLWVHRKKMVSELSGGMKRRLLIAKALVHKPRLLLLDEPTAGVDIDLRNLLWEFIIEMKNEGLSILLTTHYLEEAEHLCDRIGVIHHGKLRRVAPTQTLLQELGHREIILTVNNPIPPVDSPYLTSQSAQQLHFLVPSTFQLCELLKQLHLQLENLRDISVREGNLQDVFQKILKDKEE